MATLLPESNYCFAVQMSFAEVYNSAIDFAEELLPPAVYNAFLFSLSLHTYSPTVQLFLQVSLIPTT